MKLKTGQWVVVVDGAKGLVLTNEGTALEPSLRVVRSYNQDNPRTSELGRDRPTRTYESTNARRSAGETPDLHQRAEDEFVTRIVGELEADVSAGSFKEMVVVAPPVALGAIRKAIGKQLAPHVVAWIDKDLTKEPVPQITRAVIKVLDELPLP